MAVRYIGRCWRRDVNVDVMYCLSFACIWHFAHGFLVITAPTLVSACLPFNKNCWIINGSGRKHHKQRYALWKVHFISVRFVSIHFSSEESVLRIFFGFRFDLICVMCMRAAPSPSPSPIPDCDSECSWKSGHVCVCAPGEFSVFRGQLLCCNFSGQGKNHTERGKNKTTPSWLEHNKGATERGV